MHLPNYVFIPGVGKVAITQRVDEVGGWDEMDEMKWGKVRWSVIGWVDWV